MRKNGREREGEGGRERGRNRDKRGRVWECVCENEKQTEKQGEITRRENKWGLLIGR